jgi:hypothetical protein
MITKDSESCAEGWRRSIQPHHNADQNQHCAFFSFRRDRDRADRGVEMALLEAAYNRFRSETGISLNCRSSRSATLRQISALMPETEPCGFTYP